MRLSFISAKDMLNIERAISSLIMGIRGCKANLIDSPIAFCSAPHGRWYIMYEKAARKLYDNKPELRLTGWPDKWSELNKAQQVDWAEDNDLATGINVPPVEGVSEKTLMAIVLERLFQYLLIIHGGQVCYFAMGDMQWGLEINMEE